jgi:hypothetical protein
LPGQCLKKLIEKRTANAFCGFIREIEELFQLQNKDQIFIASQVLGLIVTPLFWVEARADGPGTDDLTVIGLALELFSCAAPVAFLMRIGGHCSEPDSVRRSVDASIGALRTLTSAWQEICAFVYDATAPEYLSVTLNSVRLALGEAVRAGNR